MHYSCLIAWNPYEVMDKYCGHYSDWHYDEKNDVYLDIDWNVIDEQNIYCDWFEVWWRRDYYISVLNTKEDEPYKPSVLPHWWEDTDKPKPDRSTFHARASAIKSNIESFRDWKNSWCKQYPDTYAYVDENWFHEAPQEREFREWINYEWPVDEEEFKKAKQKWRRQYLKWYKSIPDDEVITIVDYHM